MLTLRRVGSTIVEALNLVARTHNVFMYSHTFLQSHDRENMKAESSLHFVPLEVIIRISYLDNAECLSPN